ncbi:MAG: DUF2132 domain-containing protein [Flavobacteriales bacterium]|jgi:uncharacterized protein (DUF2132 family)|nr:DUF2132 domain-containing protein [Flavobacteriales bacterium]MBT6809147.1 DUF2132 domain-containing protein [Flavobacteriales bacterium]
MKDKKNIDPTQKNNPLHGIRLVDILEYLVEEYGWKELGEEIKINCFNSNPSIKSSLKFLRKTQWARNKVEKLYVNTIK